jgi:hypothetical protein
MTTEGGLARRLPVTETPGAGRALGRETVTGGAAATGARRRRRGTLVAVAAQIVGIVTRGARLS